MDEEAAGGGAGATPPRILIVDDSPVSRSVIQIYLDGLHYSFAEAADPRVGLEQAGRCAPALVIVDYNMPGMNGLAFVERLRAHETEGVRTVPVVLLTGEKSQLLPERSKAAGVTAFLRKPVSSNGLRELVQKLVPTTGGTGLTGQFRLPARSPEKRS